jgi:hypothetical protein
LRLGARAWAARKRENAMFRKMADKNSLTAPPTCCHSDLVFALGFIVTEEVELARLISIGRKRGGKYWNYMAFVF